MSEFNKLYHEYITKGKSCKEIAKDIGMSASGLYKKLAKLRIRKVKGSFVSGKNHHQWKGGRVIKNGYIRVYSPEHPYRDYDRYVAAHHLIMEKKIGRYILKGEEVHHINGDKLNNNIDNLFLSTKREHAALHQQLQCIGKELYKRGIIGFNNKIGQYYIK
ncbi:hypothetical protein LCGC14_0224060 [marine sediment metagenome]|uniref:HNH nuclease domain-containing protein n=1 Tax=marine sediment metagenome TaxID=412755 RepID=A0A0F9XG15_9ZZZZ